MESKALNLGKATGLSRKRIKVRKKVRVRMKLDDGKQKRKRKQNLLLFFVMSLIFSGILTAYVLYKMDQNSMPEQFEIIPYNIWENY